MIGYFGKSGFRLEPSNNAHDKEGCRIFAFHCVSAVFGRSLHIALAATCLQLSPELCSWPYPGEDDPGDNTQMQ